MGSHHYLENKFVLDMRPFDKVHTCLLSFLCLICHMKNVELIFLRRKQRIGKILLIKVWNQIVIK